MSMFTLAITCLTTSNLPWFMDLTFQVPMQYHSLQHRTFFLSPVTSIAGCCFYFGSILSFFLELFLHWSPVAYWAPTDLGNLSFSVLSFCLFILFMGFSSQEYWSGCQSLKVVLKILQARLQQYMNCELPDVQAGFRKGRGTRDQIANIHWIIEKARGFQKTSISALLTMPKYLIVWITVNCGKFWKIWEYQTT